MKYLVLLISGASEFIPGQNTSQGVPNITRLAGQSYSGKIHVGANVPTQDDMISILPILGYDPQRCYNGEGSLLAARAGVHLEKDDIAFCCDLVTLKHPQEDYFFPKFGPKVVLENYPDDSVEDELGKELIRAVNAELGTESIVFYPVRKSAHLMVWSGGKQKLQTFPPGEMAGKIITPFLPKGDGAATLVRCMEVASQFLQQHPLNEERMAQDKAPLNGIWISRPGRMMELPTWEELYGLRGGMIADDGMVQGIGQLAGLTLIETPDMAEVPFTERCQVTARGIVKNLAAEDFIFAFLPAAAEGEIPSFSQIDQFLLGPVLEQLDKSGEWKMLLLESPSFSGFPRKMPYLAIDLDVSFMISGPGLKKKEQLILKEGYRLMSRFIKGGSWS